MTATDHAPDMLLWLSDARGVYIPRDFANCFTERAKVVSGVNDDNWEILEAGPEHELYWEAWTEVLDRAIVTSETGVKYRLHQDGDLWLIPEGMEWSDEQDTFVWPDEENEEEGA
jgi:hypothetical protein